MPPLPHRDGARAEGVFEITPGLSQGWLCFIQGRTNAEKFVRDAVVVFVIDLYPDLAQPVRVSLMTGAVILSCFTSNVLTASAGVNCLRASSAESGAIGLRFIAAS